jgi:gamma-glutamylcysteine synthetase
MPQILIKISKKEDTILFHSLMGTYSHLAWVRTEIPEEDIISVTPTDDMLNDTLEVLDNLKEEVDFKIIEITK